MFSRIFCELIFDFVGFMWKMEGKFHTKQNKIKKAQEEFPTQINQITMPKFTNQPIPIQPINHSPNHECEYLFSF